MRSNATQMAQTYIPIFSIQSPLSGKSITPILYSVNHPGKNSTVLRKINTFFVSLSPEGSEQFRLPGRTSLQNFLSVYRYALRKIFRPFYPEKRTASTLRFLPVAVPFTVLSLDFFYKKQNAGQTDQKEQSA